MSNIFYTIFKGPTQPYWHTLTLADIVTRLASSFKAVNDSFPNKSSPNICDFLGCFEEHYFRVKMQLLFLNKYGLLVIPSSGHTGKAAVFHKKSL